MTNDYQANNGKLIKSTYGNEDYKEYFYNDYGQTTKVKLNGSTAYAWSYNSTGQAYKHTDSVTNRIYNYVYDSLGRIIREYGKNTDGTNRFASEYTYDLSNNLKKVENSTNTRTVSTAYAYDKENRPTKTTINSSVNYSYVYDTLGRLDNIVMGNTSADDIIVNYDYYVSARDTNLEDSVTYRTTQIKREEIGNRGYTYTYDKLGNITAITEKKIASGAYEAKVSYTYDALGQLTRENNLDLNKTIVYTYDNSGNITSRTEYPYTISDTLGTATKTVAYAYDTVWKDQLKTYDGQNIDYDAIGNPISYKGATLAWQGRQLTSYKKGDLEVSYKYDADGLRTYKKVGSTVHEYEYSGGKLFYEKRGDNQFYYRYDALGNLATITRIKADGEIFNGYVICNSRGDVEEIRYASGELYARYVYDSWGNTIAVYDVNGQPVTSETHLAVQNPIRYRGYYWDSETKLYYLQSRYYDPVVGRFVNADSLVDTSDVIGFNMYAYCGNNPVVREDGGGNFWNFVAGGIIGGIIGGVIAAVDSYKSSGKVNLKKVAVGVISGAASGVVAASGLGMVAQACISAGISATSNVCNQVIDIAERDDLTYKDFNIKSVAKESVLDGVTSLGGSVLGDLAGKYITKSAVKAADAYDNYLYKSFSAGIRESEGKSSSALVRQANKFLSKSNYYNNVTKGVSSAVGSALSCWKLFD